MIKRRDVEIDELIRLKSEMILYLLPLRLNSYFGVVTYIPRRDDAEVGAVDRWRLTVPLLWTSKGVSRQSRHPQVKVIWGVDIAETVNQFISIASSKEGSDLR